MLWISEHLQVIIFSKDAKILTFQTTTFKQKRTLLEAKAAAEKQEKPILFEE
jgi:hypothetical protein